ncbi:MAG: hypothetical protein KGJ86_01985 [Chloroflexota bacterium]|nr:hypothetical protein [Chloroflexota bacterium]
MIGAAVLRLGPWRLACLLAIGLLSACAGQASPAPTATPARIATPSPASSATVPPTPAPTPTRRARLLAIRPGVVLAARPSAIAPGQMGEHVGELVTVRGPVKWCQRWEGHAAEYSFDIAGRLIFEIALVDQPAFTAQQLAAYCTSVTVTGVVSRQGRTLLIPVISPDQVSAM